MNKLFSITNGNGHKQINLLGLKLKFRRKGVGENIYSDQIKTTLNQIHKISMISVLMKDYIFKMVYQDKEINFYLPNVYNDAVQTPILLYGTFFEIKNLEHIRKYINKNSVILDAGANIGNHTIYFSEICKAQKVFAYEPQKHVFNILKKNNELNNLKNVEIFNS